MLINIILIILLIIKAIKKKKEINESNMNLNIEQNITYEKIDNSSYQQDNNDFPSAPGPYDSFNY